MKTKLIQLAPIILVALAIAFREFSLWCIFTTKICYGTTVDHLSLTFAKPLYFFALYSLPLVIVLIFVSRESFKSWLRFAVWALPLAFIFIATQPVVASLFSTDRDDASRLAATAFSITSLVIIIFASLLSRLSSREGSSVQEVAYEAKGLKALFAASVGLLSIATFSLMGFLNVSLDMLGLFLFAGVASIVANLYALYHTTAFWYEGRQSHKPLGQRLVITLSLLSLSIAGYCVFWKMLFI